jgi:hypothetical protein
MRISARPMSFAVLAAVTICAAIAVALLNSGSDSVAAEVSPSAGSALHPEAMQSMFGVADTSINADSLPPIVQRSLASTSGTGNEVQGSLVAGTTNLPSGAVATVVGNGQTVCLATTEGPEVAVTCGTPEEAATGQLVMGSVCKPGMSEEDVRIVGLAPDDVSRVQVLETGSVAQTAQVASNVYEADVSPNATAISGAGALGHAMQVSIPVSQWALPTGEHCAS